MINWSRPKRSDETDKCFLEDLRTIFKSLGEIITWLISCLPSLPVQFKTAPATVLFPLTISARHWWRSKIRQIWSQTFEQKQMQIKHFQEWVSRSLIIDEGKDYTGYLKSGKLHGKGRGAQDMTQWLENIEYQHNCLGRTMHGSHFRLLNDKA